jgi:hypothetical protein
MNALAIDPSAPEWVWLRRALALTSWQEHQCALASGQKTEQVDEAIGTCTFLLACLGGFDVEGLQ